MTDTEWRFLVDENIDPAVVDERGRQGVEAERVPDVRGSGADDFDDILPYCRETQIVLITNNVRDFNAVDLTPDQQACIVIVHDKTRSPEAIASECSRIVAAYPSREAFQGFESADDWSRN